MAQRTAVVLSGEEREVLERWARRPKSSQALAFRCRVVLAAAEGQSSVEIADELGCNSLDGRQVAWCGSRRRRLDGLHVEPRPVQAALDQATMQVERVIVEDASSEQPKDATHWSTRSMAAATGMSPSAVSRIWRAFGLKPHQTETFKLSPDPQFIDKVRDIVGLYLNPPEAAVVHLCRREVADPGSRPLGAGLEGHSPSAGGFDAHFEFGSFAEFACEVRHERIPLRVGPGVGEDGPDDGGRRVDVDLAAKFAHVPAWSLGPKRHDKGGQARKTPCWHATVVLRDQLKAG